MRKTLFLAGILLAGSAFFSSCNKKLKNDIEDLEKQLTDLQNQQNQTNAILGANEPISATTTFTDDNGNTKTVSATYFFKSSDYSTQYMEENSDGTYYVYFERFSDVEWYEGVWMEFTYDPATQTISDERITHYWDDNDSYGDRARYYSYLSPAPTINVTVNSINTTTGAISINVNASADAAYGNSYTSYVPNPGESVSTSFSFNGTLRVFPYDGSVVAVRKGVLK